MSEHHVPVGTTPVPQYPNWQDHRRALRQTASGARSEGFARHAFPEPSIDIIDGADSITVVADLPGFARDDIRLLANDRVLTVTATRDEYEGDGEVLHSERHLHVERRIELPIETNPSEADAVFENGELRITLPKEDGRQTSIAIRE